jgi:outer membrane protein OmpA-like peptidoglycan-associated protein
MINKSSIFYALIFIYVVAYCQNDIPGSKDHRLFLRSEGFYITEYKVDSNSSFEFIDPQSNKPLIIKGRKTVISYKLKKGLTKGIYNDDRTTFSIHRDTGMSNISESNHAGKSGDYYYCIDYGSSAKDKLQKRPALTWVYIDKTIGAGFQCTGYTLTIMDEERVPIKKEDLNDLMTIGRVELYTIYFLTNQYKYEKESEPTINNIVSFLAKEKNIKITIEGAADTTGSKNYNLELSRKRATYIKDAIVSKGIDSKRLKIIGIGESMDKRDEDKVFELQLNRRTTLIRN